MKYVPGIICICLFLCLSSSRLSAQSTDQTYRTALGVKFYPGALSLKHFVSPRNAVEGLGYFYTYGFRLTGLFEIHGPINGAPGLRWYVGPGAHIGFWNTRYKDRYNADGAYFGIDGVLGLDYKFDQAPINISLDWQPSFTFGSDGRTGFDGGWGGFGIRYTF